MNRSSSNCYRPCLAMIVVVCNVSFVCGAAGAQSESEDLSFKRGDSFCLVAPPSVDDPTGIASGREALSSLFEAELTNLGFDVMRLDGVDVTVPSATRDLECQFLLEATLNLEKAGQASGKRGLLRRLATNVLAPTVGTVVGSGVSEMFGGLEVGDGIVAAAANTLTSSTANMAAQSAMTFASAVHARDKVTLGYRLLSSEGGTIASGEEQKKAKDDGEEVLTELVATATQKIARAATRDSSRGSS